MKTLDVGLVRKGGRSACQIGDKVEGKYQSVKLYYRTDVTNV